MLSLHFIWIKCQQPPICLNYGTIFARFSHLKIHHLVWHLLFMSLCTYPVFGATPTCWQFLLRPQTKSSLFSRILSAKEICEWRSWCFFNWGVCFLCVLAFLLFGMDDGMVSYRWGGWLNWYEYVKFLYLLVTNMPVIYIQDLTLSCSFMSNIFEECTHPHFHGNIYIKFDPSKYSKPSCGLVGKHPVTRKWKISPKFLGLI